MVHGIRPDELVRLTPKFKPYLQRPNPTWPDLVHPFASAIDTALPVPPARVHLMLRYKAPWVEPDVRPGDDGFEEYPEQSIEDWHKRRGLWVD